MSADFRPIRAALSAGARAALVARLIQEAAVAHGVEPRKIHDHRQHHRQNDRARRARADVVYRLYHDHSWPLDHIASAFSRSADTIRRHLDEAAERHATLAAARAARLARRPGP